VKAMANQLFTQDRPPVEIDNVRIRIKRLGRKKSFSDLLSEWQTQLKLPKDCTIEQLKTHIATYNNAHRWEQWILTNFNPTYKRIKAQKIFLDCWNENFFLAY
jgi:hypothetical protein